MWKVNRIFWSCALMICNWHSYGQEVEAESGIVSWPADFFVQFRPENALDIINQVPGFVFRDSNSELRGAAASQGNVLINGRRSSGKNDRLQDILRRIPATNVISVQFVSGPSNQFDMGQDTTIVNVITQQQSSSTRVLELDNALFDGTTMRSRAEFILAGKTDKSEYTVSTRLFNFINAWRGTETLLDNEYRITSSNAYEETFRFYEPKLSFNYAYHFNQNQQLNLQGQLRRYRYPSVLTQYNGSDQIDDVLSFGDFSRWGQESELSASWFSPLSNNTTLEWTVLGRGINFNEDTTIENFIDAAQTHFRLTGGDDEYLSRAQLIYRIDQSSKLNLGLEYSVNKRFQKLALSLQQGDDISDIPLPGSNAQVKEKRGELNAIYSGVWNEHLRYEIGSRFEFSTIESDSDASAVQDFSLFKPEFKLLYQLNSNNLITAKLQRNASQLVLADFISSVNTADGGLVNGGNASLIPSRSWLLNLDWETRLDKDSVLRISLFGEDIKDAIDRIPVFDGTLDAPGNAGDAYKYGVELEWSKPFNVIEQSPARLDVGVTYTRSNIIDPITNLSRVIGGVPEYEFDLTFKQPLPRWDLNFEMSYKQLAQTQRYRLTQVENDPLFRDLSASLIWSGLENSTFTFTVDYLLKRQDDRVFENFLGSRLDSALDSVHIREKRMHPVYRLLWRTSF